MWKFSNYEKIYDDDNKKKINGTKDMIHWIINPPTKRNFWMVQKNEWYDNTDHKNQKVKNKNTRYKKREWMNNWIKEEYIFWQKKVYLMGYSMSSMETREVLGHKKSIALESVGEGFESPPL